MKINFNEIPVQNLKNFKGGEKELNARMYSDENNKIMSSYLVPGASIGMHQHVGNSEIIYFLKGTATIIFDGEKLTFKAGECHYCPEGSFHTMINECDENVEFFAVVPTHNS